MTQSPLLSAALICVLVNLASSRGDEGQPHAGDLGARLHHDALVRGAELREEIAVSIRLIEADQREAFSDASDGNYEIASSPVFAFDGAGPVPLRVALLRSTQDFGDIDELCQRDRYDEMDQHLRDASLRPAPIGATTWLRVTVPADHRRDVPLKEHMRGGVARA